MAIESTNGLANASYGRRETSTPKYDLTKKYDDVIGIKDGDAPSIALTANDSDGASPVLTSESRIILGESGLVAKNNKASIIADSRTADYRIAAYRTQGKSWIAWANAFMGSSLDIIGSYAIAGNRSDQYFASANFNQMLTDGASIAIIGYPFVNDLSQAAGAGYTDVDGNAITLSNLKGIAMARHLDRVKQLLSVGKTVVVCTEPGSTSLTSSAVALLHSINEEIRATYGKMAGVFVFDPVEQIWERGVNSTSITFKTGYSADGTHASCRQGYFIGKYAASKLFPRFLTEAKRFGNVPLGTSVQKYPNLGYATATGGTVQQITGTDPIPANILLRAAVNGLVSYSATIAPAEDGSGNELTLTLTSTGVTTVRLDHTGANITGATYTSGWSGGLDVEVVSSSNCRVYGAMQLFTNQGTEEGYALYSGDPADFWTADGRVSPVRMQSEVVVPPSGSSTGLAPQYRLWIDFKAAGSVVLKTKAPTIYLV